MKKSLLSLVIFLTIATSLGLVSPAAINLASSANAATAVPVTPAIGKGILVKFKSSTSLRNLGSALRSAGCRSTAAFRIVKNLTFANITSTRSVEQTLALLRANPLVEFAEPDYIISINALPNDPQFINLYGLNNNAQTGGTPDADIDAPEAWNISTGNNTVIAVVDSGLDYNHVDIQGNVWRNSGEIANNGIDDDGNGYIDDIRGWDFANNDNDPIDDENHGTHVSGTIAATGNNGVGVTGINWSARIMPLKFITAAGTGSTADAIAAIDYAVANGARVINASWGGPFSSLALSNAISAANSAGVLFVAAAGNNGTNNDTTPSYPASFTFPNVISVAATDTNDNLASFSNFGVSSVHLGAPGVSILSTLPANNYASFSGTSMAAPYVAGVAGLALAVDPTLSVAALKAAILDNVDAKGSLIGNTVTGGRLNAFNTLNSLTGPVPPPPITITVSPATATVPVGGNIQFSASGSTTAYSWSVNPALGTITSAGGLFTATAPGITTVTATDGAGNSGNSGNINIVQVNITPGAASLSAGGTQQFTATGGFAPYAWSSSNPTVASINATNGLLTAISAGTTRISVVDNIGAIATSGNIIITQPTIAPQTAILAANSSLQFSATGGTAPYTWASTNSAVASISTTSGLLSALSAGTTTITATDANGTVASSGTITVRSVSVSPQTATVNIGATLQFSAAGGVGPYTWSTNNTAVASININSGLLSAVSAGSVSVFATDSAGIRGNSNTISITAPPPPAALVISPQTNTLAAGQTTQFSATGGTQSYTWRSSNPATATINASGLLTAIAAGTTTITVTDSANTSVTSGTITVTQTQINPGSAFLATGQTLQLSAVGGVAPYTWSSSNTAIANINVLTGLLTTISAGTIIVTATDSIGQTTTSGSIVVSSVLVAPQSITINTGSSQQFTASGGTGPYSWNSSNTTVATINANTGLLTALTAGNTIVTATDTNIISGSSANISVTNPPPPVITLTSPATTINIGANLQLTATGGTAPYTWNVSNTTVASIGVTNGLLSGLAAGTAIVTATDSNGFSGNSATLTILDPAPAPAFPPQIQPQAALLTVASTLTLTVVDGTAPFVWTTSNPNTTITIINANSAQLSSTAAGTTTITIADANNILATTGLIEFRAISVTAPTTSVDIGATLQMSASGGTAPYTWTSNSPAIATINTNGLLTGITAGTVSLTATDADNFSHSVLITVIDPATTIIISPLTANIALGNSLTFAVNGIFTDMMMAGALIWTSSNPAVATINNFGVLTTVSPGTVIITASDGLGNTGSTGTITIDPAPPIVITPQTASVEAGTWLRFSASGGTGIYVWSVSDPFVAGINAFNGWLFSRSAGTVIVTATDTIGNTAFSGIITVTPATAMMMMMQ